MSWEGTYSHNFLLALDLWAAGVFFNVRGITISTLSGLVRDGKDAPFQFHGWQRSFLRWIEPKLSRAHVNAALLADRGRAQWVLDNTPIPKDPEPPVT